MDYRTLMLLRAARETGVIDAVTTDAATPQDVAGATGITARAAEVTLATLEADGFLTYVDGEGYLSTARVPPCTAGVNRVNSVTAPSRHCRARVSPIYHHFHFHS